ncbi:hypothetical protein [Streptomyces chryseus]|uniref:Uncharacterized protein n=1 Tax=Streptomyces chryseus TaxID=68186 RepID=A0ABQ3DVZ7_9ACTN|nr:hypothetical protein [Streptomyces chryseus]GGX40271.1 hypothetical protein GCM10010353_64600 [Streptomyces chryseus]GHB17981.1 hypothetical protein GCM10010346_47390 [Streptomyces chryseus]
MRSAETQAAAIAAMLTAATGSDPRLDETPDRIRVEADIPEDLPSFTRAAVLAALTRAPRYGHDRAAGGDIVWAELDREVEQ